MKCPDTTATLTFKLRTKSKSEVQVLPKALQATKVENKKLMLKGEITEPMDSTKSTTIKSNISPKVMLKPSADVGSTLESDNKRLQE